MKSVPQRGSVWLAECRESLYTVWSHTLPRSGTDFIATLRPCCAAKSAPTHDFLRNDV